MAGFETLYALRDLDLQTPEYFRREMWAHGDLKTLRIAGAVLRSGLDPHERSARVLCTMLRLVSEEEWQNAE